MSEHRGWFRSFYYVMGWEYNSENDYPTQEQTNKKAELNKQIILSKLKMNKQIVDLKTPYDLQKVKPSQPLISKQIQYGTRYNKISLP